MTQNIIVDGDFGGDELQVLTVFLGAPEKFNVLGVTAVHGNTDHDQVLVNAGAFLRLLKAEVRVPRYAGAKYPSDADGMLEGDNAHGSNGIGGIAIPPSNIPPANGNAIDFILEQLKNHPPQSIVITATGPLTNIALAYAKDPDTMRRVKEIVVMGGCTELIPAHDMPERQGNITPFAEFNFYMAAQDAGIVMESGLPITLFPMNCTQHMDVTPERQEKVRALLSAYPEECERIVGMITASEWLDKMKFDRFGFMHDIHTALYVDDPSQYEGKCGDVRIETGNDNPKKGQSHFTPAADGTTFVMSRPVDTDHLFETFLKRLAAIFGA